MLYNNRLLNFVFSQVYILSDIVRFCLMNNTDHFLRRSLFAVFTFKVNALIVKGPAIIQWIWLYFISVMIERNLSESSVDISRGDSAFPTLSITILLGLLRLMMVRSPLLRWSLAWMLFLFQLMKKVLSLAQFITIDLQVWRSRSVFLY